MGIAAADAQAIGTMFRGDIVTGGIFEILDRNNMNEVLKEQQFQTTGCTESACAVKLGKMLNMEYMIYGSVSKLGTAFFIQVEVINIETTRIVLSSKEKFTAMENSDTAIAKIVDDLRKRIGGMKQPEKSGDKLASSSGMQPNGIKTVLFWSAVGLGGAGVLCNGFGIWQWISYDTAKRNYNDTTIANSAALATLYYNDAENSRFIMNVMNISAYSCYALAAGALVWWLVSPDTVPAVAVVPSIDQNTVALQVTTRF
ncbi:MAG: CsgG/HfaB family protein [Spirochaetota bacterium]